MLVAKHRLRRVEVPAPMRERLAGVVPASSSPHTAFCQGAGRALRRDLPPQRRAGRDTVTPLTFSIAGAIASVLLVLVVLELIRKRRLKERYALLWLVTGIVLLVLSLWRSATATIADWFGVETYPLPCCSRWRVLHPARAARLLDGDLEARRPERHARAALAILEEKVKERDKE